MDSSQPSSSSSEAPSLLGGETDSWNGIPQYYPSSGYWDYSYQTRMSFPHWKPSPDCIEIDYSSENRSSIATTMNVKNHTRYQVKVISPRRKSNYYVKPLQNSSKFTSVEQLKEELSQVVGKEVEDIGYISPGHGLKGKQNALFVDDDLEQMYEEYRSKREILLWCYAASDIDREKTGEKTRKRSHSPGRSDAPATKREACKQKIAEVEVIIGKLKEKHETKFSVEQLNAWAHMIHIGKHSSYEAPPNLPYFGKHHQSSGCAEKGSSSSASVEQSSKQNSDLSPSKRISLRTECISQLDRWYSLLEKGGITQEQYESLKKNIFSDMSL